MKTFRKFLSLLLCGACLISFAACTDSGADTKNPSSPENILEAATRHPII